MQHTSSIERDYAPTRTPPRKHSTGANEEIRQELISRLPSLRAFSRSLCPNPTQADDLVQETLVKALANLHSFEPGTNMRAWLFTILRNTFYSETRKRKREVEDPDGAHASRLAERPRQDGAIDLEDFKRAFNQLPPDHREVLMLVGASGCSYEEAAQICGRAIGTIKSRVNRARRKLAVLMEPGYAPVVEALEEAE